MSNMNDIYVYNEYLQIYECNFEFYNLFDDINLLYYYIYVF